MLMTLDQWLARFFGAGRRADRPAPLSQRASFGLDGMEMRQIDSNFELQEWDEEPESEPSPYRPHFRRPRAVFVELGPGFGAARAGRPAPRRVGAARTAATRLSAATVHSRRAGTSAPGSKPRPR